MKSINPNLYPRDGYFFEEHDGTKIIGTTWDGVAGRLASYRKRHNLPPGNPAAEVRDQACKRNPGLCVEDNPAYHRALKVVTLKSKILGWFSALKKQAARKPIEFIDTQTALARAGTCIGCPFNQPLADGCASCRASVNELRADILAGRSPHAQLIHRGCEILGVDLATAVHLDNPTIDNPDLPGHCWHKRTLG